MKNRVTLADISAATGLSQTTISMILSGRQDVSFAESTIKLVRKTAKELGYNGSARKNIALFNRRAVMVVCPFVANHFYSTIIQTVQSEAANMRCNVLVYITYNDPDEESKLLRVLSESSIGGIIFAFMPHSRNFLTRICKSIPVVVLADKDGNTPFEVVELHNYQAGALIATHLAELGHENIACVSTPFSTSVPARNIRFKGLRDAWSRLRPRGQVQLFTNYASPAMARANIQLERMLGEEIAMAALDKASNKFTAFVAINDMLAYGVMDALHALGKSIPGDYSLCGMDNDFSSSLYGVNLTSVEHFMAQNASQAFRLMYRCMEEETSAILPAKIIRPELIVRSSTAAPARENN